MSIASKHPKLRDWVNKNPQGYMLYTYREIAEHLGMSHATVNLWLPRIVAERDGIAPSAVRAQRNKVPKGQRAIPFEKQKQILELHDRNCRIVDIAYFVEVNESTVYRYLKKAGRIPKGGKTRNG